MKYSMLFLLFLTPIFAEAASSWEQLLTAVRKIETGAQEERDRRYELIRETITPDNEFRHSVLLEQIVSDLNPSLKKKLAGSVLSVLLMGPLSFEHFINKKLLASRDASTLKQIWKDTLLESTMGLGAAERSAALTSEFLKLYRDRFIYGEGWTYRPLTNPKLRALVARIIGDHETRGISNRYLSDLKKLLNTPAGRDCDWALNDDLTW